MTHISRVRMVACVLVAITLLVTLLWGRAFGINANNPRKIVRFRPLTSSLQCLLGSCINLKTEDGMRKAIDAVTVSRGVVLHQLSFINALAVELPTDSLVGALTDLLSNLYVLEVVDDLLTLVDPICPSPAPPSIPESYSWGQRQINVPAVHPEWQGSGVTVAVLDTGIDPLHLEFDPLTPRVAMGYNALAGQPSWDYRDNHGHGTHMAGIIAANLNSLLPVLPGIVGVAPKATLAAVKVLDSTGHGYVSDVINGLRWVYDHNQNKPVTDQIRLVNMSFGFAKDSNPLRQAIKSLKDSGVIMVASAGNRCAAAPITEDGGGDGDCLGGGPAVTCPAPLTDVTYPAAYQGVLAVGASDIHDQIPAYSLPGPALEVVAPGGLQEDGETDDGQILSTNIAALTNTGILIYGQGHGTSHAAAHVTGAVALVLQFQPGYPFAQVQDLLKKTAVKLTDPSTGLPYPADQQGAGRIDVGKMIEDLLP